VRRLVGYGRFEGIEAAAVLAKLHEAARLYVGIVLVCDWLRQTGFGRRLQVVVCAEVIRR
jgi:hypothetical protein